MNWWVESGVLDEGDSAALLQDTFENHFRDMFLNVTHLKYITSTHSFKAALIAFLVTSWLHDLTDHDIACTFRALIWNETGYARAGVLCVQ